MIMNLQSGLGDGCLQQDTRRAGGESLALAMEQTIV